jgi:hypothetical protein
VEEGKKRTSWESSNKKGGKQNVAQDQQPRIRVLSLIYSYGGVMGQIFLFTAIM